MRVDKAQAAVGAVIRRRREAMKLSQESFADSIGMHRAYYWSIENGRRNVSIKLLVRVADGLKVRLWELFKDAGI